MPEHVAGIDEEDAVDGWFERHGIHCAEAVNKLLCGLIR
jgi:hypothetical protein